MSPPAARTLGLASVLCIGVNAIIGSGIYRLPGRLGHYLGPASWTAFAIVGLLLVTVALCFAEGAGMFEGTGGPYVYTREAFGTGPGFVVGWMAWVVMITSLAAVANAVPGYLGKLVPALAEGNRPKLVVVAIIVGLGLINYFGVKPGSITTNVFTVAKIVPLLIFVVVGLGYVSWNNVALVPVPSQTCGADCSGTHAKLAGAMGAALFAALFPCQGFETAPVPAGETRNPKRNVPIAVIGSLLASVVFYVLIQLVAYGTTPSIALPPTPDAAQNWSTRPIADAAQSFLGPNGATFMALGACISMIGYCSGSALVMPRYLVALADDRLVPPVLGTLHARHRSPYIAIALGTGFALVAGLTLDFDKLVDLSNVAVIIQYAGTCFAVAHLRLTRPELPRNYRVPGGAVLLPFAGVGVCALLAWQATWEEFAFSGVVIVIGSALALAYRKLAKIDASSASP